MHFFKTAQILTTLAVSIMALPTPGYTPTNQNTGDIVARSDTLHGIDVATSTGANKQKRSSGTVWTCANCQAKFTDYDSFEKHGNQCKSV